MHSKGLCSQALICYDRFMALFVLLVLAWLLRVPHLNGSFWLDEAAQALESARPLAQQHLIRADFQPPLIHYLTHFALNFSASEWWLRTIVALIPGLITIAVFYLLAKKWFSARVAFWSSLLLATSSFHIFFSQELRPYSLPAMFALLAWFWLERLASAKSTQLWTIALNFLCFSLTTVAGFYSSYLYPLLLISQALWVFACHRQTSRRFVVASLVAGLAFLPWLPNFLQQLQVGGDVRQQLPGWDRVVSLTPEKSLFLTVGKFIFGLAKIDATPLIFLSVIALLLVGLVLIRDVVVVVEIFTKFKSKLKIDQKLLTLAIAFFSPLLLAWLISFFVPILSPKRVLYILPFFYLFIASLLHFLPRKKAPMVLIGILLIINLATTAQYYFDRQIQREDWRGLHTEIITRFGERRAIAVFSHPDVFAPWRWYDNGKFPTLATGTLSVSQVPDPRALFKPINNYQYVLVFDYLRSLSDPENLIIKEVTAYGFSEIEVIDRPNIGFVRVFAKPEAVLSSRQLEF